jgi:metal-responsive CopG/Arc/MetJ family transcriptional regulator
MYTYIVERTQIYLSREQAAALDREAKRTGTTRSHLIREAIEARYGPDRNADEVREALRATAGLWSDRPESGEAYVARLRSGRRLEEIYPADDEGATAR